MGSIWQKNLDKLHKYKDKFGDTNVPKSYTDVKLARLVTTLRQQKRKGTLKPNRELDLLRVGFEFEPQQSQWLNSYHCVIEYYHLNGHVILNRSSTNVHERTLADWINRMHKMIRAKTLSEDKVQKLKLINIDGYPSMYKLSKAGLPETFEKMIEVLSEHISKHGQIIHSGIPDRNLYNWVMLQQQRLNASLLSPKEYSVFLKTGIQVKEQDVSQINNTGTFG